MDNTMDKVAKVMSDRGCPVNREAFEQALAQVAQDAEDTKGDVLRRYHDVFVTSLVNEQGRWMFHPRWSVNAAREFWMAAWPPITQIPQKALGTLMGARVDMLQPFPYFTAKLAGSEGSEWLLAYASGSDIHAVISDRLGLERKQARLAFFEFLYGKKVSEHRDVLLEAYPWLDVLQTAQGGQLGKLITKTCAQITREAVCQLFQEREQTPTLVHPDTVVGSDAYVKRVGAIWESHGLQVKYEMLAGDA